MNIKIQLSLNDYKDAQWLHMRPKTLFRYIGIFVLVFLIMCLIGIIIKAVNRGSFDGGNIIYLVCLGYLLFLFFYYYPNRFKKLYNQHKLIKEPMVFGIEDSGIKLKTPSIDANLSWDSFIKWKEGKKLFILFDKRPTYLSIFYSTKWC